MNIIAKLSYWILQSPKKKKSITTEVSFEDSILGALDQFRTKGYVEKLKGITPESLPSNNNDLLEFLYHQIGYT